MEHVSDEDIRRMAQARVGFRMHAITYVLVNGLLIGIWWITASGRSPALGGGESGSAYFWPIWPLLGWGIGLAINGFAVYGSGKGWERREEEKIRAQLKR